MAVAAVLAASASVAGSPTASAETTLRVSAGFAGTYAPGAALPVRVVVSADRLLSGVLEVKVSDGPPTLASVEVPGGSEKEFLVLVPTDPSARSREVTARLPDGSRQPPTARTSVSPANDQELVGLLPGALAGRPVPGPAPLVVDAGTARFVPLGPIELERAPDSLAALGTVGVGRDELGGMAAGTRQGLLAWLETGGRLLVDAEPGTRVAGLPDEWQPGSATRSIAGRGEVRLTAGAMAGGRWSGLIEPSPRAVGSFESLGGPPIGDSLARAAGFRLPRISWLVGFLVVYVIVIGPGLFVILRRRGRSELAWVAIPLAAFLFTGGSYVAGRTLRQATEMVHGTVVTTGTTGARAITYLGVVSRRGGTVSVAFPPGWLAGAGEDRGVDASALNRVTIGSRGPEGRLPLETGQFGLVSGAGPVSLEGILEVTATSEANGQASGTARNGTAVNLEGAVVFVGSSWTSLGPLAAGEQRPWRTEHRGAGFEGPPPEVQLWMQRGPFARDAGETMTFSLWDLAQRVGRAGRGTGSAVVLGWTSQFDPPIRIDGRAARPEGRTLVVGAAPVTATALATDLTVRREVVRGGGFGPDGFSTVVRLALPPGRTVDPSRLSLRTPPGMPLEIWADGSWAPPQCSGSACAPPTTIVPGCPPGAVCEKAVGPDVIIRRGPGAFPFQGASSGELDLPAGAVRDGIVYVRIPSNLPPESIFGLREKA
jgi:hypothetical protein